MGEASADYDVVVVGSGASGLCSAVVAAKLGLKVLVAEKTEFIGGTSAYSGGGCWIPQNHHAPEMGEDSREQATAYLKAALGDLYEADRVNAYLDSGPEVIRFLEDNSDVRFQAMPASDYFRNLDHASVCRFLMPKIYDGRALKDRLKDVRLPLPGLRIFRSMQIDPLEIEIYKKAYSNFGAFALTARRVLRYAVDVMRYGKGARMAMGNALVGGLFRAALDSGVEFWRNAPALRLIADAEGHVRGVVIGRDGGEISVGARRGVILASGGFGANPQLQAQFTPKPESHLSVAPPGNVGDGIKMARAVGAVMGDPAPVTGTWVPVSVFYDRDGNVVNKYPHFGQDRARPGCILVDENGRRFANESLSYVPFVQAMKDADVGTAWMIGNRAFLRKWGMGLAMPSPASYRKFVRAGYLIEASSLSALAQKIGVDPAVLTATVQRFNEYAVQGIDPDFERHGIMSDMTVCDPEHKPNVFVGPIGRGPYYALKMHPGDVGTVYGLKTSPDSQVLRADGSVIDGLYAVGLDQNSVMRGVYPSGGCTIGPGLTFGYRAARHIAGKAA